MRVGSVPARNGHGERGDHLAAGVEDRRGEGVDRRHGLALVLRPAEPAEPRQLGAQPAWIGEGLGW